MIRFKLTIAYDGTAYCGWQRQPEPTPTIQREIEKAAGRIVSHPVTVLGSSRTDTGVHAFGQVAVMEVTPPADLDADRLRRAINSQLPQDILIRSMEEVAADWDVRKALRKRYRYVIWADKDRPVFYRHYVYHFYRDLDLERIRAACEQFVGTHDFEAFKGQTDERDNTVRTIFSCGIHRRGPLVIFAVEGSGFLYHMVRTMVGTVIEVGTGHWEAARIAEIVASRDRQQAGPCLPAQGLHLQWIRF